MKVKSLKPGSTIGIICPASKADMKSARLPKMEEILTSWGFRFRYGASCYQEDGYLAGTDDERRKDLEAMFLDASIDAILCLKGGYGTSRFVDCIDYSIIRNHPKLFLGFSDITVLLNNFYTKAALPTLHGQVGIFVGSPLQDQFSLQDFHTALTHPMKGRILSSPATTMANTMVKTMVEGVAKGVLVGGNLSLISHLVGTPYEIPFRDHIVFIEEVNEAPYRIDRMLTQLRLSGCLQEAKGFIIGHMTDCAGETTSNKTLDALFYEFLAPLGKPVLTHFASGHEFPFINLPIGLEVSLDATNQTITVLEELYEED